MCFYIYITRYSHEDINNDGHSSVISNHEAVEGGLAIPESSLINCPQPSIEIDRLQEITETDTGEPQCPYCQYSNIATESVKDHMNVCHERRIWYCCPLCPLNSSCKRNIINHLRKKHDLITNDVFLDAILLSLTNDKNGSNKVNILLHLYLRQGWDFCKDW